MMVRDKVTVLPFNLDRLDYPIQYKGSFLLMEGYTFFFPGKRGGSLKGWQVLDYGCGVSDIGILLSLLGAQVTICDLADRKLALAEWRYRRRNLDLAMIEITQNTQIPELGKGVYDLIIATEIFEHVPDPLKSLRALTESLRLGGLLFDSMGGTFDREPGGDHLAEALNIGKSQAYQTFCRDNYVPVGQANGMSFLFQKKGSFR